MRTKRRVSVLCSSFFYCAPLQFAQAAAPADQIPPTELPVLDHFSPDIADRTLDPCRDLFKYAGGKWLAAHNFERYLKLVNAPASPQYIVTTPNFFKGIEVMLKQRPLKNWRKYLWWQMVSGSAALRSDACVQEKFDFFGRTLSGAEEMRPRWKRCVDSVDGKLGEALGQAYVLRAFPPENRARVLQMVQNLETAKGKDIESLDWMSPETRARAQQEFHAMLNEIDYPEHFPCYSSVQITRDHLLADRQHAVELEFERGVSKIGQAVARTECTMIPPTTNAYEEPTPNPVNFPAGILQPPYFDMRRDDAVNCGDIGAAIDHEITHGLDDRGRKFDAQGNLRQCWTPADPKQYEVRGKSVSEQYTQEVPEEGPGVMQDGNMTLGEDTADNGGTRIAFTALKAALSRAMKYLQSSLVTTSKTVRSKSRSPAPGARILRRMIADSSASPSVSSLRVQGSSTSICALSTAELMINYAAITPSSIRLTLISPGTGFGRKIPDNTSPMWISNQACGQR